MPLMFASRLTQKKKTAGQLRPNFRINSLFESILEFENSFIMNGAPLPLGGSLLMVGQKPLNDEASFSAKSNLAAAAVT